MASLTPGDEKRRRLRVPRDVLAPYRAASLARAMDRAGNDSPLAREDERRGLRLFDRVHYRGRQYVLVGFSPMGVRDPRAYIQDQRTGDRHVVPLRDVDSGAVD